MSRYGQGGSKIMKKNKLPNIYSLDDFGLKITDLKNLNKKVYVDIHFLFSKIVYGDYKKLSKLHPSKRKEMLVNLRKTCHKELKKIVPLSKLKLVGSNRHPTGMEGWIHSADLYELRSNKFIEDIWIKKISGLKKIRQVKENSEHKWYSIKCHIVIQIEGQKKGLQTHETRVNLVRAKTEAQAVRKCKAELYTWKEPYMNSSGEYVRWKLVEVIDVWEIYEDPQKEDIVEVYYELKDKRFSSKYRFIK